MDPMSRHQRSLNISEYVGEQENQMRERAFKEQHDGKKFIDSYTFFNTVLLS